MFGERAYDALPAPWLEEHVDTMPVQPGDGCRCCGSPIEACEACGVLTCVNGLCVDSAHEGCPAMEEER